MISDAYVINLDHREDRWKKTKSQLEDVGFTTHRFSACYGKEHPLSEDDEIVDRFWGNPGYIGSLISRRDLYQQLRGEGVVAVFEDDVELKDNFEETFHLGLEELPESWETCYLGGWTTNYQKSPESYSKHLAKVFQLDAVHGLLISEKARRKVLKRFEENWMYETNDDAHKVVQDPETCFCFEPPIVYQRPSYSDITENFEDYTNRRYD